MQHRSGAPHLHLQVRRGALAWSPWHPPNQAFSGLRHIPAPPKQPSAKMQKICAGRRQAPNEDATRYHARLERAFPAGGETDPALTHRRIRRAGGGPLQSRLIVGAGARGRLLLGPASCQDSALVRWRRWVHLNFIARLHRLPVPCRKIWARPRLGRAGNISSCPGKKEEKNRESVPFLAPLWDRTGALVYGTAARCGFAQIHVSFIH